MIENISGYIELALAFGVAYFVTQQVIKTVSLVKNRSALIKKLRLETQEIEREIEVLRKKKKD